VRYFKQYAFQKNKHSILNTPAFINESNLRKPLESFALSCVLKTNHSDISIVPLTNGVRWYLLILQHTQNHTITATWYDTEGNSMPSPIKLSLEQQFAEIQRIKPATARFPLIINTQGIVVKQERTPADNGLFIIAMIESALSLSERYVLTNGLSFGPPKQYDAYVVQARDLYKIYVFLRDHYYISEFSFIRKDFEDKVFKNSGDDLKRIIKTLPIAKLYEFIKTIDENRSPTVDFYAPYSLDEINSALARINLAPVEVKKPRAPSTFQHNRHHLFSSVNNAPAPAREDIEEEICIHNNQQLRAQLAANFNLTYQNVSGDGSCQFYAVAYQLMQVGSPELVEQLQLCSSPDPEKPQTPLQTMAVNLRDRAANYVEANPACFETSILWSNEHGALRFANVPKYVSELRKSGFYGDLISLKALQMCLETPILVFEPSKTRKTSDLNELVRCFYIRPENENSIDLSKTLIITRQKYPDHYTTFSTRPSDGLDRLLSFLVDNEKLPEEVRDNYHSRVNAR